jgi:AcrR family transcriptional regulator
MKTGQSRTRKPEETAIALLDAAEAEFNEHGFHGTDSNRIARRAGYAPQTFYRHFADKTAIFVAVYQRWWKTESNAIAQILRTRGSGGLGKAADTMIAFHVRWRGFRRSLRHLSVEEGRVRAARVEARKAQTATFRALLPASNRSNAEIYASLIVLERLCDAVAEGEFADMDLSKKSAREAVIAALGAAYDAR